MSRGAASDAGTAQPRRRKAYAALDLGTNNCRLMVAVRRREGFSVVDTFSRIVRLGEGLATTGRISDEAQERAIDALKRCAEIIARWEVDGLRCVTTEACRSATNGPAFVERVREETGLRLEVIGAEQEARLALGGCASLIDHQAEEVVVFDIGGGSTEVCLVRVERGGGESSRIKLQQVLSLPFGVVRLSDGLKPGGFAGDHYDGIRRRVAETVGDGLDLNGIRAEKNHLIGTSGTATSLAAMHKGLVRYRRSEIDGSWLRRTDVTKIAARLQELGHEGRRSQPCIGEGRADLIMPGCAILEGILDATGYPRVRVADRGLREGLITQLLADKVVANPGRPLHGSAPQPAE